VIAVNSADAIRGKIFSLFHEIAHLALREEGVCDLVGSPKSGSEAVEAFCNRVAAAVLVPQQDLLSLPQVSRHEGSEPWAQEELTRLANRYVVSVEALVRRLLTLGKATKAFYEKKRKELQEAYAASLAQRRFGRSTPAGTAVNRLGLLFTRLVLDAYHTEAISAGAVSDYLDIRLKHLDAVEKTAFGPQPAGATAR
jgi:Zn-dependent peptidase ImmA (M78 family)